MAGIVFIGDDFTGASDTLATFAERGAKVRLFLSPPALEEAADLDVVGIATDLRAQKPETIAASIGELGANLTALQPRFIHYKVCSTFDSAPHVGSIGAAVQALEAAVSPQQTVVLGGQPSLGRFCVFGNLFARALDGVTHRIDRHPTMSRHPVTPMGESDLRLHLQKQGLHDLQLVDHRQVNQIDQVLREGRLLLVDALQQSDIEAVGRALRARKADAAPILLVGSSSVAEALWPEQSIKAGPDRLHAPGPRLAVAGSMSSATAAQVAAATRYEKHPLTPQDLDGTRAIISQAASSLAAGRHVLVHLQPDVDYGRSGAELSGKLAELTASILQQQPVRALAVAGGDTSSMIVEHLGFRSLSFASRAGAGVAICRGHAPGAAVDGTLLLLKGGQVGNLDVFETFASIG